MARLFGTDGIRGLANSELTPELALSVASAAVRLLGATAAGDRSHRPVVVVGRDPRASGEMIEAAIVAGLTAAGADVLRAGVLPTPATAYLTAETGADFGVMISASHNPMPDNGVKLFSRGGHKLTDEVEDGIEALAASGTGDRPTGAGIGRVRDIDDATGRYLAHLRSAVGVNVSGLRLVVDCANGAASAVAPQAYRQAGARVTVIHADPDGLNINDRCGSTHLEALAAAVRDEGADLGIAHDGDADRALAIASDGSVVDGDAILAVCAIALHEAGNLAADTVVATVMSNLGFHHAMRDAGISVLTTPVGDRYLLEALRGHSLSLGGEQSGHLVFAEYATTGDGLLTGLRLMARIAQTGNALADLAAVVRRLPQVLVNVRVADKATVAASEKVTEAVVAVERQLGDSGRVLLRPSGTESVVRVMVEAPTDEQAAALASRVATAVAGA